MREMLRIVVDPDLTHVSMLFLLARSCLLSFGLDTFFTTEQVPLNIKLGGTCSVLQRDSSADYFYTLQPIIAHNLKNWGPQNPLKQDGVVPPNFKQKGTTCHGATASTAPFDAG